MTDFYNYAKPNLINNLCDKLDIPQEIKETVLQLIRQGEINKAEPHFSGLFDPETAHNSSIAIEKLFSEYPEGSPTSNHCFAPRASQSASETFGYMTVLLIASIKVYEIYKEKEIDTSIYYDTMSFFKTVLDRDLAFYGKYSFTDTAFWYYREIAGLIYKLGVLEYEMLYADEYNAKTFDIPFGAPMLSVHIPFRAKLNRKNLNDSYAMVKPFFRKHFPQYENATVTCGTWLLSPELKGLLPQNSNILEFQSDYKIIKTDKSNGNCFMFLFGNPDKDIEYKNLPEDTSLRKAAKQHLINGGTIGTGTGVCINIH